MCLVPTFWLTSSTPCAGCMCVCVCTHMHTHTLPQNDLREGITQHACASYCQKHSPTPNDKCLHRLAEPPKPRLPMRINKLRIHERMCTSCSDCVTNMYADVKNTCATYQPACTGSSKTIIIVYTPQCLHEYVYWEMGVLTRKSIYTNIFMYTCGKRRGCHDK